MTARPKIEAAQRAADRLEELGEPFHANAVWSLARSNSALVGSLSLAGKQNLQLHAELRSVQDGKAAELEEFLPTILHGDEEHRQWLRAEFAKFSSLTS